MMICLFIMLINLETFKTKACEIHKDRTILNHNFTCQFYHGKEQKRRNPFTSSLCQELQYSQTYIQEYYDPKMCCNFSQYLFHPNTYKTKACKTKNSAQYNSANNGQDCKNPYCPYTHQGEDVSWVAPYRNLPLKNKKIEPQDKIGLLSNQLMQLFVNPYMISNETMQQMQKFTDHLRTVKNTDVVIKKQDKQQKIQTSADLNNENKNKYNFPWYNCYRQFYYQQKLPIIQDRNIQFKDYKNIINKDISFTVMKYITAFLNAQGGVLYIGIDDHSFVQGLTITQSQFDKFQLKIDKQAVTAMNPPLHISKYTIRRIPVLNSPKGKTLWVIQILVPPAGTHKTLTCYNRQCYMRMTSSTYKLDALNLIQSLRMGQQAKSKAQNLIEIYGYLQRHGANLSQQQLKQIKQRLQHLLKKVDTLITSKI